MTNLISGITSENREKANPDYQNRAVYIYVCFFGQKCRSGGQIRARIGDRGAVFDPGLTSRPEKWAETGHKKGR